MRSFPKLDWQLEAMRHHVCNVMKQRSWPTAFQTSKQAYHFAMCRWLAQPVLLGIACLLASQSTYAQHPYSDAIADSPAPDIRIAEVTFLGAAQMPASDQNQIADLLKQETSAGSIDGIVDETEERVRATWQDRGYFKVQVSGDATILTSSPVNQRIALRFRVRNGLSASGSTALRPGPAHRS